MYGIQPLKSTEACKLKLADRHWMVFIRREREHGNLPTDDSPMIWYIAQINTLMIWGLGLRHTGKKLRLHNHKIMFARTRSLSNAWCHSCYQIAYWAETYEGLKVTTFAFQDYVTIRFAIDHCYRPSISNGFRDICMQLYLDHDLELPGSRNVTSHVSILIP